MRRISITLISLLIIFSTLSGNSFAENEEKNHILLVAFKSRIDNLELKMERYVSILDSDMYNEGQSFGKIKENNNFLIGPELFYSYSKLKIFLRGFYLYGKNDLLEKSETERTYTGIDIGIGEGAGGVFFGYRKIDTKFLNFERSDYITDNDLSNEFNLTTDYIVDHDISDFVIGLFGRSPPDKPGFKFGFEIAIGLQGLIAVWDEEKFIESPFIFEAEFNSGYKFEAIPLIFNIGYGIWYYTDLINDYERNNNPPTFGMRKYKEELKNLSYGFTMQVTYSF